MKGYEWTFLQKNVDFGDCGRFFLENEIRYIQNSITGYI